MSDDDTTEVIEWGVRHGDGVVTFPLSQQAAEEHADICQTSAVKRVVTIGPWQDHDRRDDPPP